MRDAGLELFLSVRKKHLWPIAQSAPSYKEDDFFDVLEYLFQKVSKPIKGTYHSYNDCGMHWESFDRPAGKTYFREKVNSVLDHYEHHFELSPGGEILSKPDHGFEAIFGATLPSAEQGVIGRVDAAILKFRRHGARLDDRRQAVRDLADVLEFLRPTMDKAITSKDEADLFNLANNFGIRHHNDKQKTSYDKAIWLSWMFYFYLATIHVILRRAEHHDSRRLKPGAASGVKQHK